MRRMPWAHGIWEEGKVHQLAAELRILHRIARIPYLKFRKRRGGPGGIAKLNASMGGRHKVM